MCARVCVCERERECVVRNTDRKSENIDYGNTTTVYPHMFMEKNLMVHIHVVVEHQYDRPPESTQTHMSAHTHTHLGRYNG